MKKTLPLLCTCAFMALLLSCNSKESLQEVSSSEVISFYSQVGAILNNTATKTEEVVSLSEFHVTAVTDADGTLIPSWENVVFTKDGDLYTSTKLWPAEDPHYEFLASNAVITHQDGAFLIDADSQTDIVVAYNDDVQYKETNDLTFKHIYARMDFKPIQVPDGYTVSDIALSFQPRTSGIYNVLEGYGQYDGRGWSHVQTEERVTVTSEDGIHFQTEDGRQDFYVIPGEYLLSASWTIRKDDFTLSFTDESFAVDLTGGSRNGVQISVFGMPTAEKAIAFNVAVEPWDDRVIDAREVNPRITFTPDELSFGPKGGTLPVQMNRVTGGVSQYEYSLDGGATWTEGLPAELDIAFSADEASFSVSMAAADGPSTITDVVWPSESRFNAERGAQSAPIDLSLEDVRGDANTDGRTTANCYVVHAPGWYMFPLVYGNAITDGTEQEAPGERPTDYRGDYYRNALGKEIKSAWIDEDYSKNEDSFACTPQLVWQSREGLVQVEPELKYFNEKPFIVFHVDPSQISYANVVIGAKDDSVGQEGYLWSWHIWVYADVRSLDFYSPYYKQTLTSMVQTLGEIPTKKTTLSVEPYSVLVRFHFGEFSCTLPIQRQGGVTDGEIVDWELPYYVSGRKDPLMDGHYGNGGEMAVADAIRQPALLMSNLAEWEGSNEYLWETIRKTGNYSSLPQVGKSIYDPCPPGYCVPKRNFGGITACGMGSGDETSAAIAWKNAAGHWMLGVRGSSQPDELIPFPQKYLESQATAPRAWGTAIASQGSSGNVVWSTLLNTSGIRPSSPSQSVAIGGTTTSSYLVFIKPNKMK